MQAAIAADSRRYNVFTFLEDEGVDDVIKSEDTMTPEVDDATNNNAKHQDDANKNGELLTQEPHTSTTDTFTNSLDTWAPTKSSEDVADLEFRGIVHILSTFLCHSRVTFVRVCADY